MMLPPRSQLSGGQLASSWDCHQGFLTAFKVIMQENQMHPLFHSKVVLSYNQSSNSSSFLVLFDHGYCPVGLFCAATTRLIVEHKWTVNTGKSQFRNKINFFCTCSGKSYSVVFSAFSAHYEVCLVKEALPIVKYNIYQNICVCQGL